MTSLAIALSYYQRLIKMALPTFTDAELASWETKLYAIKTALEKSINEEP